ncbi:osmotically inducible protein C [Gonapodya prolifera JEL478]|uniref:Osmotically inducible protein C n=1 Tax=Gonapodya prolifera (strain JEL478) TaxID=1344416 RepID=A0A138ZXQ3_GONPJ|nr:osmotically inducible protein C [Gonapodya prolifera JEL478]|eukprot:KXS09274.1 osmotically inducible protein C [Gonapodya prolifera JEL478]
MLGLRLTALRTLQPLHAAARRGLAFTPLYTAEATATGARNGKVKSSDGIIDLELSVPKSMGGPGLAKSNPEQLFAAGYSACFQGAMGAAVAQLKYPPLPSSSTVHALVSIGKGDGGFDLAVEFEVAAPGYEGERLRKVVEVAHGICPYSRATKGNISVTTKVL